MSSKITVRILKTNVKNCEKIKESLQNEYLNSFMTLDEFSEIHSITKGAIQYVLNLYSLKKDIIRYNPSKNPKNIEKIQQTKINHFGSLEACNKQASIKSKETRKDKYSGNYLSKEGIDKLQQKRSLESINKQKSTMLNKYGIDNIFKNSEYMTEKTLKKLGVTNASKLKSVKVKKKLTSIKNYGTNYPLQSEEIKQKIVNTNLLKYGVKNANQNEDIKFKSMKTRLESGNQKYNKSMVKEFLNSWELNRKPTISEFQNYLLESYTNNLKLSNTYAIVSGYEEFFSKRKSYLEQLVKDFLDENNIIYVQHDRKIIKPLELDFYLPNYNLALEVNDIYTHNSSQPHYGNSKVTPLNYHYDKTNSCEKVGIRLIHLYEPHLRNEHKWAVLKDIILHACNKSKKVYARNTELVIAPAIQYKKFFEENNIAGYRGANTAFMLLDDKTNEPLMGYTIGPAYFGKGKYDAEITRGACKLGYVIVGGASKLWKSIIKYYETHNLQNSGGRLDSIVYYVDRNYYNGNSMIFLDNVIHVKNQPGFWNYFVATQELKNRNPHEHTKLKDLEKSGKLLVIGNSGTSVNVWHRS